MWILSIFLPNGKHLNEKPLNKKSTFLFASCVNVCLTPQSKTQIIIQPFGCDFMSKFDLKSQIPIKTDTLTVI